MPADGLKFFALYQRYDSLGQAIAQLVSALAPACLTHNDLNVNNVLLHTDWQQSSNSIVRLIDWERAAILAVCYCLNQGVVLQKTLHLQHPCNS